MRDHEPASAATSKRALPEALRNLKRFNAKRKFRASIEAIYAEGKMEQAIHGLRVEAMTVDMLKGETLESVRHLAAVSTSRARSPGVSDVCTVHGNPTLLLRMPGGSRVSQCAFRHWH